MIRVLVTLSLAFAAYGAMYWIGSRWIVRKRRRWDEMEAWGRSDRHHGVDFLQCPTFKSRADIDAWRMGWLLGEEGRKGL